MTPTNYLLLSICLLSFVTTCFYAVYCNLTKVELAYEDCFESDQIENSNLVINEEELYEKPVRKILIKSEEDVDIQLELKKCNQRLNRNLKTLSYISFMKANNSLEGQRLVDLENLKVGVQYEIVKITKQINFYKEQIKDEVAA